MFLSAGSQLPHGPGTQAEREQQPALPVLRPPHQEPAEEDPHRQPGEARQKQLGGERGPYEDGTRRRAKESFLL